MNCEKFKGNKYFIMIGRESKFANDVINFLKVFSTSCHLRKPCVTDISEKCYGHYRANLTLKITCLKFF